MMRKLLLCVMATVFLSAASFAAPKAEVFGGFQYTHFDGGPNAGGWNAALTGNFNSWLGIRADFSGRVSYWVRLLHIHVRAGNFSSSADGETVRARALR